MRWNPVLREWMTVAAPDYGAGSERKPGVCPYCTEKGSGSTDLAIPVIPDPEGVFALEAPSPRLPKDELFRVAPARGRCEAAVHHPDHQASPAAFPLSRWEKIAKTWQARAAALESLSDVQCLFIFEEGGGPNATRPHPVSHIVTFPFIPARIQRKIKAAWDDWQRIHNCLFCRILERERKDGSRVVMEDEHIVAFVPFHARFPFEVHVYPRRHLLSLPMMNGKEIRSLSRTIRSLLRRYKSLFGEEFSYAAAQHAAPTGGPDCSFFHWHMEWYLKGEGLAETPLLSALTLGGGPCVRKSPPEVDAEQLREAPE